MDLDNSEFIVTLESLEERDNVDAPARYNQDGSLADPAKIIWKFGLHDMDGEPLFIQNGSETPMPIYVWMSTSTSGYYDPKDIMTSRARRNVHALIGRILSEEEFEGLLTISEDDEKHELPYALVGESAVATLNAYKRNDGSLGVGIASIRKYIPPKAPGKAKKATGPSASTPGTSSEDIPF